MSFQSAVPDRTPIGWLILIPLGCLALLQALFVWYDIVPVLSGGLADTDAYMRMVRVMDLHERGQWFDSTLPRVNPPEGHVQHWTRPLDALLLAGALALEPWLGFRSGLHLWGVLISPVLFALSLIALNWATVPIFGRDARLLACLAFLMQPLIQAYTIIGRPDHHSLQLLLFVLAIGLTLRLVLGRNRPMALVAGGVAALSVWISPEALIISAGSLGVLGFYWLLGDRVMAPNCRDYLIAATAGLALAVAIERGPEAWSVVENDRLSILHLALFGLMATFWAAVAPFQQSRSTVVAPGAQVSASGRPAHPTRRSLQAQAGGLGGRLIAVGLGAGATVLAMLIWFPQLAEGPLGQVDPLYRNLRLERIVEYQPLIMLDWLADGRYGEVLGRAVRIMGIALVALPFLVLMLGRRERPDHRAWVALAVFLGLWLPIALLQVRFATYAQAVLIIPYAGLVTALLQRLTATSTPTRLALLRPPLIVVALFWSLVASAALPRGKIETAGKACPTDRVAAALNRLEDRTSKTILAYTDYAPELLYRTPHSFLSIPNHRPQPGFAATHRILTTVDEGEARAELTRFGVDWILLCPSGPERKLFRIQSDPETFYLRLVDGTPPSWLRRLPVTGDLAAEVRLFEVLPTAALAGADRD